MIYLLVGLRVCLTVMVGFLLGIMVIFVPSLVLSFVLLVVTIGIGLLISPGWTKKVTIGCLLFVEVL